MGGAGRNSMLTSILHVRSTHLEPLIWTQACLHEGRYGCNSDGTPGPGRTAHDVRRHSAPVAPVSVSVQAIGSQSYPAMASATKRNNHDRAVTLVIVVMT